MSEGLIKQLHSPTFTNLSTWKMPNSDLWMAVVRHGDKFHTSVAQGKDLASVIQEVIEAEPIPVKKVSRSIPQKKTRRKVPL